MEYVSPFDERVREPIAHAPRPHELRGRTVALLAMPTPGPPAGPPASSADISPRPSSSTTASPTITGTIGKRRRGGGGCCGGYGIGAADGPPTGMKAGLDSNVLHRAQCVAEGSLTRPQDAHSMRARLSISRKPWVPP
jgi:hypothetical protein